MSSTTYLFPPTCLTSPARLWRRSTISLLPLIFSHLNFFSLPSSFDYIDTTKTRLEQQRRQWSGNMALGSLLVVRNNVKSTTIENQHPIFPDLKYLEGKDRNFCHCDSCVVHNNFPDLKHRGDANENLKACSIPLHWKFLAMWVSILWRLWRCGWSNDKSGGMASGTRWKE